MNPLYECKECGAIFNQKDAPLEDDADGDGGQIFVCPKCLSPELRQKPD